MVFFYILIRKKGFQGRKKNLNYYVVSYDVFKVAFNLKGKDE